MLRPPPTEASRHPARSRRRRGAVALAAIVLATGAIGCSSGKPASAKATTTTARNNPGLAGKLTIAQQLPLDAQYSTFLRLATESGLLKQLAGHGHHTLLIPSTEAFAALGTGALAALEHDPAALSATLRRHVLQGSVGYLQLLQSGGKAVTTIDGQHLPVVVSGTTVTVGGAPVVKHDIQAKDGIIQVLGKVITTG